MGIETAALIGGGGKALGGISDFMEKRNQADVVKTQGKLAKKSSEGQQGRTVGTQVARTGASGVELSGSTLDLINQTNKEFELDQQIIKESSRLDRDALKRQGKQALLGGMVGGASTVAGGMKPSSPKLPNPNIPTSMGQNKTPTNYGVRLSGGMPLLGAKKPVDYGVRLR